jgi:hypothetical protein
MAQPPRSRYSPRRRQQLRSHGKPSEDEQGAMKDRHPTPGDDETHEQGDYKDQHAPLRDPSEGQVPAVVGQEVEAQGGGDFQGQAEAQQAPVIGVRGEPIEDGERDPGTIAEEQRRRSEEMNEMGIHAWVAAHDSRTEEEKRNSELQIDVVAQGGGPAREERRLR